MMKDDSVLKISLSDLRNKIDVKKTSWENMTTTNCYAYALGLDIPEENICKYAYDPGTIGNSKFPLYIPFTYDELIENILIDLSSLDIKYQFILPNDVIDIESWKIAIFISQGYSLDDLKDFHLLRLRDDGFWYHKNGISGNISNLDCYDQPITNPSYCSLNGYTYTDTLSLTLKKPK